MAAVVTLSAKDVDHSITIGTAHLLHLAILAVDTHEKTEVSWDARCAFGVNLTALRPFTTAHEKMQTQKRREIFGPIEAKIEAEVERLRTHPTLHEVPKSGDAPKSPQLTEEELRARARRTFQAELDTASQLFLIAVTEMLDRKVEIPLIKITMADLDGPKNKHIRGELLAGLTPMLQDFGATKTPPAA